MDERFLPIGSVVEVKSISKRVMIIGYYSVEYSNQVKLYDYVGIGYPEGFLLKSNFYSFNNDDIVNVEFTGYESELFNNFKNNITNKNDSEKVKVQFDENGVVLYDGTPNESNSETIKEEMERKNPFEIVYEEPEATPTPIINEKYTFDNEGFIVAEAIENLEQIKKHFEYKFDKDGNVISEEETSNNEESNEAEKVEYKFDENGNVIGE